MTVAPAASGVHRFAARAMGSPLRLTLVGSDDRAAATIWSAVRDDVEATEQALSRFRESAELVGLNRRLGVPVPVGDRLYRALTAAERARRVTSGRFDARVLRDLERLGEHGATAGPRTAAHPAEDVPPGEPSVRRRPRSRLVRIEEPIDLGGIGKGLALRWAARLVERLAAEGTAEECGYLLEAGGDIACRGPAPDGATWRIAIEAPDEGVAPAAVVAAVGGAVMTSSRLVRHWRSPAGDDVHHLIDPATHEPAGDGLVSVTVAGPDPAWSEVWSKSLFVAGRGGIGPLARSRGLAAWWIDADGRVAMTPAARERTLWVRDEAATA
ncbi:MAG TPA: FAD:protein FMN transferase [Candidatus Limnocylindrales bacterium]|nr:FAD:protein FMN transferase [Candidatus Limnocylindrales bacterium]